MFLSALKEWTLCTRVWYVNSLIHAFCTWVSWKTVAYATWGRKTMYRVKIFIFYMNLIVCNCLFIRLKYGSWVEGEGTWRHGPRSSTRFPHGECFTLEWVIEIFLCLTYAVKCPPLRVFDKLLGSWYWHVWPSRWVSRGYIERCLFHFWFITTGSSGELGRYR